MVSRPHTEGGLEGGSEQHFVMTMAQYLSLQTQLEAARAELVNKVEFLSRLQAQTQEDQARIDSLANQLGEAKVSASVAASRLKGLEEEVSRIRTDKERLESKLEEAKDRASDLKAECRFKDQSIAQVEGKLADLYSREQAIRAELIDARAQLQISGGGQSHELVARGFNEVSTNLRDVLEVIKQDRQDLKEAHANHRHDLEQQLGRVIGERNAALNAQQPLNNRIAQLAHDHGQVQEQLTEVRNQRQALVVERAALVVERDNANAAVADKEVVLAAKTNEVNGLNAQLAALTLERNNANAAVATKANDLATRTGERDTFKAQFEHYRNAWTTLSNTSAVQQNTIANLTAERDAAIAQGRTQANTIAKLDAKNKLLAAKIKAKK